MKTFEHGMMIYQPWSTFIIRTKMLNDLTEGLNNLCDKIKNDPNHKDKGDGLAGQIEEEWDIEPQEFLNATEGFREYIQDLVNRYMIERDNQTNPKGTFNYDNNHRHSEKYLTNYPEEDRPQVLADLINFDFHLTSAWFNDQKDNEYNPMHTHIGDLSGVLFLKIPEYLPPRRPSAPFDGSIEFRVGKGSPYSLENVNVFPEPGDIFLFESGMSHAVYPFRTADEKGVRRSLSFNIMIAQAMRQDIGGNIGVGYKNNMQTIEQK